jgi:hypothetical protein
LTSNAPSTPEVDRRFRDAIGRYEGRLTGRLHLVAPRDKAAAVHEAFADMDPYIGYRCVARLGRDRRVTVVDMNWDPMAAVACERLGVPHATVLLSDPDTWSAADDLPTDYGVLVVHIHGDLRRPARAPADIRWPTPESLTWLKERHAGGRCLAIGTTLVDDPDMMEILGALDDGSVATTWAFFRGPETDAVAVTAERLGQFGANNPVFAQGPIDFDHVLAVVMDSALGAQWSKLPGHLGLPSLENVVLPTPATFRHTLDADVVVLAGDPGLGKTTVGHLLAYLRSAWNGHEVRTFDGPDHALAALGAPEHASDTGTFVLENPLVSASSTTAFYDRIDDWVAAGAAALIVTTSLSAWDATRWPVVPCSPADWYELGALQHFATHVAPEDRSVEAKVQPGWLDTPGRIRAQAAGLSLRRTAGEDRTTDEVAERRALLEAQPALAWLCALARVQELAGQPPPAAKLEALAGSSTGPARDLMTATYHWERVGLLRLRHQFDRDAVDQWLADHKAEFGTLILKPDCPEPLAVGWKAWTLLDDARAERWDAILARDAVTRGEHAAHLLDAAPCAEALAAVVDATFDCWSAQDFAYALLRGWPDLPQTERRRALQRLLDDVHGIYAILEACLYLRRSAPIEVWDELRSALWRALDDGDAWQAALALDGFAWRPPTDTFEIIAWSKEAYGRLPELKGALAVLGAYHHSGVASIGLADELDLVCGADLDDTSADMAARLVRWHFRHQSRARAQLARQHWVDKEFLCRTFAPQAAKTDDRFVHWLLTTLVAHRAPGWAVQAAMFLSGGIAIPLGERSRGIVRSAFRDAPARDIGVTVAVCTYPSASVELLGRELRPWVKEIVNRDAVLDTLVDGVEVDGDHLIPPRFAFCREPEDLLERIPIRFPRLATITSIVPLDDFVARVEQSVATAIGAARVTAEDGFDVVRRTRCGDLRLLDDAVAAFDAVAIDLDSVVEQACTSLRILKRPMTVVDGLRTGVYEHYKGKHYLVLGVARWHSHDELEGRLVVVYVRLYGHPDGGSPMSVRPLEDFNATVEHDGASVPTFRYLGSTEPSPR